MAIQARPSASSYPRLRRFLPVMKISSPFLPLRIPRLPFSFAFFPDLSYPKLSIFRHELNNVNEFRKAIQLIALQSISFASTTSLLYLTLIRRRRDRSRREKSGGRGNGEEIPPLPRRREIERNVTGNYTCPGEEGLSWILT